VSGLPEQIGRGACHARILASPPGIAYVGIAKKLLDGRLVDVTARADFVAIEASETAKADSCDYRSDCSLGS